MELISIEIESYKSIKTPVTISFFDGLPTVLIGKNGSGKTNVLEIEKKDRLPIVRIFS